MSTASKRGAVVAGVPVVVWAIVLGTQDLTLASKILLTVLMSMPFLVLGVRVEQDGDLGSTRRRWTVAALVISGVFEIVTWDAAVVALGVFQPLVALIVWFVARPKPPGLQPSSRT